MNAEPTESSKGQMNIRFLNITLLAFAVLANPCAFSSQLLYVSSSGENTILAYAVNQETGELALKFKTGLSSSPGFITFSPDGRLMYVGTHEDGAAGVATLQRNDDGSLSLEGQAQATSSCSYMSTDKAGQFLLACHYSAGEISIYRIVDGICTSEMTEHKKTEHTAHCIELDPSGRFVFVPHTSPNKVYQFRFNAQDGTLTPNDPPFVEGPDKNHRYHEPRHYVHHPVLDMAYTSSEFGGGITAWKFDPVTGTLKRLKTLSTLRPQSVGKFYAADIWMTPNGRFAYVSNRDQTPREPGDPKQDSLAGFSLDSKTGEMTAVGSFPAPNEPYAFCIDRSGRFVYSAGTSTSTLFAYRIDQQTGRLTHFATYPTGKGTVSLICGDTKE